MIDSIEQIKISTHSSTQIFQKKLKNRLNIRMIYQKTNPKDYFTLDL